RCGPEGAVLNPPVEGVRAPSADAGEFGERQRPLPERLPQLDNLVAEHRHLLHERGHRPRHGLLDLPHATCPLMMLATSSRWKGRYAPMTFTALSTPTSSDASPGVSNCPWTWP